MKLALLYEHPGWSRQLLAAFETRAIDVTPLNIVDWHWDGSEHPGFERVINRVNAMPSAGRSPSIAAHTVHILQALELWKVPLINGARTHLIGVSKTAQAALFASLGLRTPRSIAIHRPEEAPAAAERIGYPCLVKPNIGGSGAGISQFDDGEQLALAVRTRQLDLGIDGTGLIQQRIQSADGFVYRLEVLGDQVFYAIRQPIQEGSYNYCAADGCSTGADAGGGTRIDPFEPAGCIVEQAIACIQGAGADLGGVEYLIDGRTGEACFYDFNPYSNFVADGESLLGFSPEQRFIDFVLNRTT